MTISFFKINIQKTKHLRNIISKNLAFFMNICTRITLRDTVTMRKNTAKMNNMFIIKGNPENLTITVMSSFEVNVNWSESYISEESEQKYIVEYKCDPTIMKNPVRNSKLVSSHSVYLTDLIPEVQYEVSVRNKEKGDPSIKSFRTPQFGNSLPVLCYVFFYVCNAFDLTCSFHSIYNTCTVAQFY